MLLVEESVRTFIRAWGTMVLCQPAGRVDSLDGVTATFGNVPLSFFNLAFLDEPVDGDDLRARLDTATKYAARRGNPWFFVLNEEWVPRDWRDTCAEAGFTPAMPMTGMLTDALIPPRRPAPKLDIRRVTDDAGRRAVAEINGRAYDVPTELSECIAEPAFWDQDEVHGYVGWREGRAVCTSTVFPVGEILYVAMVATLPGEMGRGYGEAVVRHSVQAGLAEFDLERTILHATEAGRPVYEAMGYREEASFVFLAHDQADGHAA